MNVPIRGSLGPPILNERTDYIYVTGLSEATPPEQVLVYCPPENHGGRGGNILFCDGHVEWFEGSWTGVWYAVRRGLTNWYEYVPPDAH